MPEEVILVSPPVRTGGRSIYPLIRVACSCYSSSGFLSATPIALFIEEKDVWSFVPLEEGITEDCIQTVVTSGKTTG